MKSSALLGLLLLWLSACGSSAPACMAGACMTGMSCTAAADCGSGVCTANACVAPSCTDGVKNGGETDVDCGGSCSEKCVDTRSCAQDSDCQSDVCTAKICVAATCTDGLKDGNETDVDCGGSCPKCATAKACGGAADCQSGVCTAHACAAPSCADGVKNGSETDVDCGGSCATKCGTMQGCLLPADCQSDVCTADLCVAASCTDGVKNGSETDVDCGGSCPTCATGLACLVDSDCTTALCNADLCYLAASCAEIHTLQPTLPDGAYTISGSAAGMSFPAWCDMTRDNGGWTLILKADADTTLEYDSAYWTNTTLLNPTDVTLTSGNAKYPGFLTLPVNQMRGELVGQGLFYETLDGTMTASQIFNGPIMSQTGLPYFQSGADWSVQPNCQSFGLNMFYTPTTNTNASRSRMGWSANNEDDCLTNDTAIGIGVQYGYTPEGHGAGFIVTAGGNKGDVHLGNDGLLWVK